MSYNLVENGELKILAGKPYETEFIGTKSEWANADKQKYIGKVVNITDDYNEPIASGSLTDAYGETDLWSGSNVDYAKDDYVIDDGKLFKCILAHTSSSAHEPISDTTHWKRVSLKTLNDPIDISADAMSNIGSMVSGVVDSVSVTKLGNLVQFTIHGHNTSSVSSGVDIYKGNLGKYRPNGNPRAYGTYASQIVAGWLNSDGNFGVRVMNDNSNANADYTVTWMYFTND